MMQIFILKAILSLFMILALTSSRVIEITNSNVQLVLKSVGSVYLLLHHPQCVHSQEYAQLFIKIKNTQNLGIVDCQLQTRFCQRLNTTRFPALFLINNHSVSPLQPYSLLSQQALIEQNHPKVQLDKIIGLLRGKTGYVTVVLQEQGLPVLDKVQGNLEKGIFYIQKPSLLHQSLFSMAGEKLGCWIYQLKNKQIEKYYCGSGYTAKELIKNLQNYHNNKLVKHSFSKDNDLNIITKTDLQALTKAHDKCKLVYFYSENCKSCAPDDFNKVQKIIKELKIEKKVTLQKFNIDVDELPQEITVRRVPELIEFCNSEAKIFGHIFTIKNLKEFIGRYRKFTKYLQQTAPQDQVVIEEKIKQTTISQGQRQEVAQEAVQQVIDL